MTITTLNRTRAIQRLQKLKGRTAEEAAAIYDRPFGVCSTCGAPALTPKARTCNACRLVRAKVAQRAIRGSRLATVVETACASCGVKFAGSWKRKFCDSHSHGHNAGKAYAKRPAAPPRPPKAKPLPVAWHHPAICQPKDVVDERPVPVVVPDGFKVTMCPGPSFGRWD